MTHRPMLARRARHLSPGASAEHDHDKISFDSGHAYRGVLPDLSAAAERALNECRAVSLQYAPRPGLPDMREWIAGYMNADGAGVDAAEILVTNGAKHAIELVCRLLIDEGDSVLVTAPTYYSSLPIFRSFGTELIEVPQDQEGISIAATEACLAWLAREGRPPPKLIYNVPDFHNPSGVTMSARRREALVELASRHDLFVVEDSPYREIRFTGEAEPTLKSFDEDGRVIVVGTFAKLIAPGLRIGWLAAPADLIARIAQLKSDGGSSPLAQRLILGFCEDGRLPAHIELVRATYRRHRDRMVAALRRELPEAAMTVPEGGYYLWLTLPSDVDGDEVARRSDAVGATIYAGTKFYAGQTGGYPRNEAPPRNHIRLSYSGVSPEEIDEGVRRLGMAYRSLRGG